MAKTLLRYGLLALSAAGLQAPAVLRAQANLSGPVAGYVADSSRPILRAISGVPGSYLFGSPLSLPDDVTRVHIASGRDFALVQRGAAGFGVLYLSGGAIDRVEPFSGAMAAADWVVFSPGAGAAILFSSSGRLQLLTGLPGAPQVAMDLDAAALPEQPLTAAVSDDGSLMLLASGHSVYRISRDGGAQLVLSAGQIVSVAILRNGTDAAVSERSTASIHFLQNVASAPEVRVLVSGLSGIGRIYPSSDGGSLFVARPGAKAVSSVDLASGEIQTFPSPAPPLELLPLRDRDTFLISARPRQPGGVFFRDGTAGRVVFIPAVRGEDAQ